MGCCCSVDPAGSSITAYVRTTVFIRQRERVMGGGGVDFAYIQPFPQAVYVRGNKLYFQWCLCLDGYHIANITTVEVIRGGQLFLCPSSRVDTTRATVHILNQGETVDHRVLRTLEFTGVRITGSDGTMIAFAATSEVFAQQLRSAADVAKMELQQNVTRSP